MSRPRIQDLLVPKLLEIFSDERYRHWEEIVTTAMDPLAAEYLIREMRTQEWIAACLRTSVLFVVDHDEAQEVISSAGTDPCQELPPLPFPRVAYEAAGDVGWRTWMIERATSDPEAIEIIEQRENAGDESDYVIDVVAISEEQQGREWTVMYVCRVRRDDEFKYDHVVQINSVFSDGRTIEMFPTPNRDITNIDKNGFFRRLPIELTHLANARGVSLVDLVDRAAKRRALRKGYVHPSIYWVDLRSAAEVTRGKSDREYHCRWLVRGHWRHLDELRRTWVKPYIKGPAGAPWKGRPVYRAVA